MIAGKNVINWGLFVLLCIIWGSSFILMKWSTEGLYAAQIASVRILSAGLVFTPFALFHIAKIPRRQMWLVILSAVFGNLLPAYLFAAAIAKNVDSSLAGILNSMTPIFVITVGFIAFKSRATWRQMAGVFVGFAGLTFLSISQRGINFDNLQYALWILLATVFYGINVNMVSHYLKNINPIHLGTVSLSFMIIPSAFVLLQQDFLKMDFDEPAVQWAVITSVALGIVGSALATVLFYILVKRAGGLFASLVTYGIPFIAILWGLADGETISFIQITCLMIILFGVYLANRK